MAFAPAMLGMPSALAFLADETLFPLEIGAVAVDLSAARLRRTARSAPMPFGFTFAGHRFEAMATQEAGLVVVDCAAAICRLPYSIEDRPRRIALSRVLNSLAGSGLRSELTDEQIVRVGIRIRFDSPATADRIVAAVVAHFLPVAGWLDLLAEIGSRPRLPSAASAICEADEPASDSGAGLETPW
jgi:hypothetical protein